MRNGTLAASKKLQENTVQPDWIRSEGRDYEDKLAPHWVDHASGRCDGIEMMTAVTTAQSRDVKARAPAKAASREQYWAAKSFRSARS